jgi:tripartite-type tricarboxylate transporter receptor subunit TctC
MSESPPEPKALPMQAIAVIPLLLVSLVWPALAQPAAPPADFYRGKTISVIVGHEAGTGYDIFGRTLARHFGRHLAGQPSVVTQNTPGAGGLKTANWLNAIAPRDGLTLSVFAPEAAFKPLYGDPAALFDPVKFSWIGNMDESIATCAVSDRSGIARVEDLLARDARFGASGVAAPTSELTYGLINFLGARIKVVQGYKGSADLRLALSRGEIDGACGPSVSTLKTQWKDEIASGRVRPIIQFAIKTSPDLPGVPSIYDLAKSAADREVFDIAFGTHLLGRPLIAPPGVPAERVRALRAAFMQTMQDPAYLADIGKFGLTTIPSSGEEAEALVRRFFTYPRSVIDQALAGLHEKH